MLEVPTGSGSAGVGIDATEVEGVRANMARVVDAHRRTLDQLATGVAIFAADHTLTFYNAAYRSLWDLDSGFLDQSPTDSAVLDRLRAARKLPEEQDFRSWKTQLHEAYRALEAKEDMWHLPDGRTLRVVTTPNPEGGVTYLFDDVTERLDLERRYDALIRVQGETLDNLPKPSPCSQATAGCVCTIPLSRGCGSCATEVLDRAPAYRGGDRVVRAATPRGCNPARAALDHHRRSASANP